MNESSIIRKIDDLGRIVIPKDIRSKLNIRINDTIEMYISSDNELIIKKYEELNGVLSILKPFIDSLADLYKCKIVVTNLEKILYSSYNISKVPNIIFNTEYMNFFKNKRLDYVENLNINLENNNLVKKLIIDNNIVGSIIMFSISKIDKEILKMIDMFLIFIDNYVHI